MRDNFEIIDMNFDDLSDDNIEIIEIDDYEIEIIEVDDTEFKGTSVSTNLPIKQSLIDKIRARLSASRRRMMEPMKPSLTKPGTKAVIMAEEPSTWIFPRSGSLFLTMNSSNMSLPLLQQSIMVLP